MKAILITPYGGTNLGDAAIQEAVIQALKAKVPGVEIGMASLAPEKTEKLHHIPSFPITSLEVQYYSEGILSRGADAVRESTPAAHKPRESTTALDPSESLISRLKNVIRAMPRVFNALRFIYKSAHRLVTLPGLIRREITHFREARNFVAGADLFIVSGGGQLDDYWGGPWGHPYSLVKWSLLARRIKARFVILSVGVCAIESRSSMRRFAYALRHANYRSYRDQTSKLLLENLSFTRNDPVFPDLAFSFPHQRAVKSPAAPTEPITVGVSPIAYLRENWPKKDNSAYLRYMAEMEIFCLELLKRGHPVVLFSSDSPDRHPIRELQESLASNPQVDADALLSTVLPQTVDELFETLSEVQVVVASRLHGILLSHLVQKPVLAISYDRKVDTHMVDVDQTKYRLDIETVTAAELMTGFETIADERMAIEADLSAAQRKLWALLDTQYDAVLRC